MLLELEPVTELSPKTENQSQSWTNIVLVQTTSCHFRDPHLILLLVALWLWPQLNLQQ